MFYKHGITSESSTYYGKVNCGSRVKVVWSGNLRILQSVSDAPDRFDKTKAFRGLAKFSSNFRYVRINRSIFNADAIAPESLEKLVPPEDSPGFQSQLPQQREFHGRQLHRLRSQRYFVSSFVND